MRAGQVVSGSNVIAANMVTNTFMRAAVTRSAAGWRSTCRPATAWWLIAWCRATPVRYIPAGSVCFIPRLKAVSSPAVLFAPTPSSYGGGIGLNSPCRPRDDELYPDFRIIDLEISDNANTNNTASPRRRHLCQLSTGLIFAD